jgi:N-acetylglutamate synthase-like GNAT family acetyltransferase
MPAPPLKNPVELPAGLRIRPARRGDVDALGALLREMGYSDGADTHTVHWAISHPEIEVFVVAEAPDKAVALVTLSHRPQLRLRGRIATVDELVVTERWRRQGVGKALLRTALERARTLGVKRLEIQCRRSRGEDVRRFYEACGFTEAHTAVLRHPSFEAETGDGGAP